MEINETDNQNVATSKWIFGNKTYNILKFIAMLLLPAVATLYVALAAVWNWGNVSQIVGTLTAVDTFLGALLGISTKFYNASDAPYDGTIRVENKEDGTKLYSLELNSDPSKIDTMSSVNFKVSPQT